MKFCGNCATFAEKNMFSASDLYDATMLRLPYEPLERQATLLRLLCEFAVTRSEREAFVVKGYAGTGKTSLMAALVQALQGARMKCVLLAPTGRAAKVFSRYAGLPAFTIHKRLYRGNSTDPSNTSFYLAENRDKNTLFIVDEASMIPASTSRLLAHLVQHVHSAPGCGIIFVGDTAQLPPVGESESLAMNPDWLAGIGLRASVFELDQPLRQASHSGILYNATRLRRLMQRTPLPEPRLWVEKFKDVEVVSGEFLAESVADSYSSVGLEETIVVTRSNFRAGIFNRGIRAQAMYAEEELQLGERHVIAKNNYYWTSRIKGAQFIANGEIAEVQRIFESEERYGHRFARVELRLPDSGLELEAMLLMTTLNSDTPSLSREEQEKLFTDVLADKQAQGMDYSSALFSLRTDPYYNALQAKYAYCLTCHKAQGGQWKNVYIDMAGIASTSFDLDFYRWLYTAVTRATTRLFLINPTVPLL